MRYPNLVKAAVLPLLVGAALYATLPSFAADPVPPAETTSPLEAVFDAFAKEQNLLVGKHPCALAPAGIPGIVCHAVPALTPWTMPATIVCSAPDKGEGSCVVSVITFVPDAAVPPTKSTN